jgi:hypothetical protein
MNAKTQLVSKLSLKSIIGKPDMKALWAKSEDGKLLHEQGIELFNVGGTVTGMKTGITNFGEFTGFLGTFGAIRLHDGVVFRSGQLFLPTIAENFVKPTVEAAAGAPVEFGFIIGIKPMKKPDDSESYEYTVTPIVAPDAVDPLAGMMAKLQEHAPAKLAAPTGQTAQAETAGEQTAEQKAEPDAVQKTDAPKAEHTSAKRK